MRCGFCGYEFMETEGIRGCGGCGSPGRCRMVRCPRCLYENPLEPALLKRVKKFLNQKDIQEIG